MFRTFRTMTALVALPLGIAHAASGDSFGGTHLACWDEAQAADRAYDDWLDAWMEYEWCKSLVCGPWPCGDDSQCDQLKDARDQQKSEYDQAEAEWARCVSQVTGEPIPDWN